MAKDVPAHCELWRRTVATKGDQVAVKQWVAIDQRYSEHSETGHFQSSSLY